MECPSWETVPTSSLSSRAKSRVCGRSRIASFAAEGLCCTTNTISLRCVIGILLRLIMQATRYYSCALSVSNVLSWYAIKIGHKQGHSRCLHAAACSHPSISWPQNLEGTRFSRLAQDRILISISSMQVGSVTASMGRTLRPWLTTI